jgi:uncharacterized protein (DUF58 family)
VTALGLIILGLAGVSPPETVAAGSAILVIIAYEAGLTDTVEEALYAIDIEREPVHIRVLEGEPVKISLRIRNPSGTPIYSLIIREGLPPRLRVEGGKVFQGAIPARSQIVLQYEIVPALGLNRIEYTDLEASGPLGLYRVRRRVWRITSIQAYPRPYPPLTTPTERLGLLETLRSRRRGWSLEFYSLREYVLGDDIRLIAWLPSARAGRLVVRENTEVRSLDVCVFLDLSLESWAGEPGQTAADWISRIALGLLEASARVNGSACYLIFTGESALRGGPGRAPEVEAWLAEQISSTSPGHCTSRRRLSRSIVAFEEGIPRHYVTVYLLGPGALPEFIEALGEVKTKWRAGAVEVLPLGRDALSAALRKLYASMERRYLNSLRENGVPAYIASTPEGAALAVRDVVNAVVKRGLAPY